MSAAEKIQEIIYQGGNMFFRLEDNDTVKEYIHEDINTEAQPSNRMEKSIVKMDEALMRFVESIVVLFQQLFASKQVALAGIPTTSSSQTSRSYTQSNRVQAFSSSKRLVEKFDQQYQSVHYPKPEKRQQKSFGEQVELVLGIVMYGFYKLFKALTFSK